MFNGLGQKRSQQVAGGRREACHNNLCFEITFRAHSTFISDNRKRISFYDRIVIPNVDASLSLTRNEYIFT